MGGGRGEQAVLLVRTFAIMDFIEHWKQSTASEVKGGNMTGSKLFSLQLHDAGKLL